MIKAIKYIAVFLLGFFLARSCNDKKEISHKKEEVQVVLQSIKNMRKLVVAKGDFAEIYNYSDSKKYFYDYLSFDKKAIVTINAKVEVGYDLSKLAIQIDSIGKQIIIKGIPSEEIVITPNVKYFDMQQSQFNTFTKEELNTINEQSIRKIKETIAVSKLKEKAKKQLFEELSRIYQLSSVYGWKVVDETDNNFLDKMTDFKN